MKKKSQAKGLKPKGKSESSRRNSKSSGRKGKSKAFRPVKALCRIADKTTSGLSGIIISTAKCLENTVKRIDRRANKVGNAIEKLHKTQTKAGL